MYFEDTPVISYSIHCYFATYADIYSISDDVPPVFPIGAAISLFFNDISRRGTLFSLSNTQAISLPNITIDRETNSLFISLYPATPSLSGSYVYCIVAELVGASMQCGGRVNLSITGESEGGSNMHTGTCKMLAHRLIMLSVGIIR